MKKQYTLLLAMLLGLLGFTASANTYTFILSGEGSLLYGTQVGGSYNFYGTVEQGTHEVEVEKYTQLYFKAADGYEIVSVFDVGLNEPKNPINTEGIYNQYVGSANKTFEVKLQRVGGSEQPTGNSATFKVVGKGSVSLCTTDGTLIQELELGEKTYENLPITTGLYKLVPGENTAIVSASEIGEYGTGVIKSDGSCEIMLWIPDPKWEVTIKEKAANKTVSMDVLTDNEIVIINSRWEAVKTLSKGQTQFELSDEYYYFVANGVTDKTLFEVKADGTGTPLTVNNSYRFNSTVTGVYVSVNTAKAADKYTFEVKAPAVKTVVLDLLSDADVVLWDRSNWTKVKTLVKGENTVEIPSAQYNVVANGVTNVDDFIVKDPNGNELWVSASQQFDSSVSGVSIQFNSANAPEKYTIEVKEQVVVPQTKDFVVNLTGKAVLKYQNGSATWIDYPLTEGTNNVSIPATVTSANLLATDGYVLESCVNKEGTALSQSTSWGLGGIKVFTLPVASLSESYTLVTVDPNAPVATTFTINVDNPANVQIMNQSYKPLSLVAGKNEFDPTEITSLKISQAYSAEKPIFSCTLDGTPLVFYQNCYSVNPTAAGQVIDIVTTWPAIDYTIDLVYTDAQNVWTRATIGDQYDESKQTPVEIVDNKVSVPAGSTLNLFCDNFSDYTFSGDDGFGNPVVIGPDGEKIAVYPSPSYMVMPNVSFSVTKSGTLTTDAAGKLIIPVKININGNPQDVEVTYAKSGSYLYDYKPIYGLTSGENTFDLEAGYEIGVNPLNEATVTMTYKVSGDAELQDGVAYAGGLYTDTFTGLGAEVNITITGGTGPVYDAEFVVNIEGFGGSLQYRGDRGGYEVFRTLQPGRNEVGLTREENLFLGGQLYIVPAEGWDFTECTDQDGNKINIMSNNVFPSYIDINTFNPRAEYNFKGVSTDKDVTLTLEGPADFWTKVLVNNQEVTLVDGKTTVRYNDLVELYNSDLDAWAVTSIYDPATGRNVNLYGVSTDYPLLAFNIKGDWTVTVDAHRFTNYDVTVNVTTANLIRLRHKDSNITLKNGANTIQVSELDTDPFLVQLRNADNGYIVAVQSQADADAELIPAEFDGGTYVINGFTGNGGVINIDVEASAEALVYTDKAANLIDCKENAIALNEGYNHVALHYADAPFAFEGEPTVYVNYEALEGTLTLRANDICKAYYEAAQPLTVTFTVAPADENMPEADAAFANVTRDYITNVADVTVPFTVMPGTFISFMTDTAEGLKYEVTVNGEKVEGVENVYTTTITADTEIKLVYDNSGSGIVTISRDQLDLNAVYFDLAGRRIDARNIDAGIYIRVAGNTATKIAVK